MWQARHAQPADAKGASKCTCLCLCTPVALEGSIVTTKSAPAAQSLAEAATEPPAAFSLARASPLARDTRQGGGGGATGMQLHLKSKPRTVKPALTRLAAMGPPLQHTNNVRMEQARTHMHMQVQVQVHDAHVSEANEADSPAQKNCYTLRGGACRRAQTCLFAASLEKRRARAAGEARARRDSISVAAACDVWFAGTYARVF